MISIFIIVHTLRVDPLALNGIESIWVCQSEQTCEKLTRNVGVVVEH